MYFFIDIPLEKWKMLHCFDEVQKFPKGLTSLKYFCEDAIQWLINAGLVHKVFRIQKFEQPLRSLSHVEGWYPELVEGSKPPHLV